MLNIETSLDSSPLFSLIPVDWEFSNECSLAEKMSEFDNLCRLNKIWIQSPNQKSQKMSQIKSIRKISLKSEINDEFINKKIVEINKEKLSKNKIDLVIGCEIIDSIENH